LHLGVIKALYETVPDRTSSGKIAVFLVEGKLVLSQSVFQMLHDVALNRLDVIGCVFIEDFPGFNV
jgi:hypothetical protein